MMSFFSFTLVRILMLPLLVNLLASCGGGAGYSGSSISTTSSSSSSSGSTGGNSNEEPEIPASEYALSTIRINWGSENKQFGDLYLPEDYPDAVIPVVIMIHGGCWQGGYTLQLQTPLSIAIAERGFAVWNIEYRSLGTDGEWPIMFLDVAAAADFLKSVANIYQLDLARVNVMGHSAGGHLALWLASRKNIDPDSELFNLNPLDIANVLTLGGIGDLQSSACGSAAQTIIDATNINSDTLAFRLQQSSPIAMLPTGVTSTLISGSDDNIVPAQISENYVHAALMHGDLSEHLIIEEADHFDLIDPEFMDITLLSDLLQK